MDYTFENLREIIQKTGRQYNMEKIEMAYELAQRAHAGQMRLSGEPYVIHPIAVA